MRVLRSLPGRLLSAFVVLVGASIVIFIAVRGLPGDFAQQVLGPLSTDAARHQLRESLGLDKSLPEQYLTWVKGLFSGDLGTSLTTQMPVRDDFAARLPVTGLLTAMAMAIILFIGVPLGVYVGVHSRGGARAAAYRIVSTIGISLPELVLGCLVVFLFSRFNLGLTVGTFVSPTDDLAAGLRSLLLPAAVLAVPGIAATARTTRDAVMNVLVEPHIVTSVARGESRGFIIRHHVLRNALVPVLTFTGTVTAYLLGGAVIVEQIFNVPGIGSYLVLALGRRDLTVIQDGVVLATLVFVLMNLALDVLTVVVNPRISATSGEGAA